MTLFYVLADYFLFFKTYFSRLREKNPPDEWINGDKGDVILIQGFLEKWFFLDEVGEKANSLGYRVHVLRGFGLNIKHISNLSQKLEHYIIDNELHDVILIGHSKGGLIGRFFLHKSNYSDRVSRIIAIASPFHGSRFGNLRFWSLSELIPGHEELEDNMAIDSKILSIRARVDTLVFPNSSPIIKYADNRVIDIVGHMRILHSQELLSIIDEELG